MKTIKKLLLLSLIINATLLKATITVTNVNTTIYSSLTSSYQLDIDNNSVTDFSINAYQVGQFDRIDVTMLSANSEMVSLMAATVNVAHAMNFGDNFGVAWQSTQTHLYHHTEFTPMAGAGTKYIDLRIFKNGNYHYAWVELSVGINGNSVNIVAFGFEDLPNTLITAGQTVSSPNSVNEFNANDFKVFPNPFTNQLNIKTITNQPVTSVKINDVLGKMAKSVAINTSTINTENLTKGIYFIEIIADNRKIVKKLIKN